ncbi:MAG: DUF2267 domain-containing protein [Elusimicrobia bacterium]|nr:DUF2267 domain-containing protein [Elusimicrobiota bacterium]
MRAGKASAVFNPVIQKAGLWLKDIQETSGLRSRAEAYSAMRAVLHALRDCLPPRSAADLAAQMPILVKGVFFDGWEARAKPDRLSRDEFMERIRLGLRGYPRLDPALALTAVMDALYRHVSRGELDSVRAILPRGVREALNQTTSRSGY